MAGILILIAWLLFVPLGLGGLAAYYMGKTTFVEDVIKRLVAGYFIMLGGFQLVASIFVVFNFSMSSLVLAVVILTVIFALVGYFVPAMLRARNSRNPYEDFGDGLSTFSVIFFVLAALLFGVRIFMAIVYQTPNGDDSYYIAQAVAAYEKNVLCRVAPYSGYLTELNSRHDLSTFPLFYAFLSRISGIHPAVIAHTVWPPVLLTVVTGMWILLGRMLVGKEYNGFFVFVVSALVMLGGSSRYTAETYLITRTWQGKGMLAGFAIPAVLWLFLCIADLCEVHSRTVGTIRYDLQGQSDFTKRLAAIIVVLIFVTLTGIFSSGMSLLLLSVEIGVFAVLLGIRTRKVLLPVMVVLLPAIIQIFYTVMMWRIGR